MKLEELTYEIKSKLLEGPTLVESGNTPAAVLVMLVPHLDSFRVVFTRRTMTVATHKGQVSLPGGVVEPCDKNSAAAAIREAHEEIGLDPDNIAIIGYLDGLKTITNFWITPVVGVVTSPFVYAAQDREVEEVFEVPLAQLLDCERWQIGTRVYRGETYEDCRFVQGNRVIWGATGRMMYSFALRMSGHR